MWKTAVVSVTIAVALTIGIGAGAIRATSNAGPEATSPAGITAEGGETAAPPSDTAHPEDDTSPPAPDTTDPEDTWWRHMEEMREHMDAVHGEGSFDSMLDDMDDMMGEDSGDMMGGDMMGEDSGDMMGGGSGSGMMGW